jgi:hypothetical protein
MLLSLSRVLIDCSMCLIMCGGGGGGAPLANGGVPINHGLNNSVQVRVTILLADHDRSLKLLR